MILRRHLLVVVIPVLVELLVFSELREIFELRFDYLKGFLWVKYSE